MAALGGHTEVVELLLSKGANIEAANNVMIGNCWFNFLISYLMDFDDYRDKIITIIMNIEIIRSAEREFWDVFPVFPVSFTHSLYVRD